MQSKVRNSIPAAGLPLLLASGLFAYPTLKHPSVDSVRIHGLYLEGDFDVAIPQSLHVLQNVQGLSRHDSAFLLTHLAVMHAADEDGWKKADFFFKRLLETDPFADIEDMEASPAINEQFRRIKMALGASIPPEADPRKAGSSSKNPRNALWYWGGAGVAIVFGALIIHELQSGPTSMKKGASNEVD